jgi:hypothetical protein
MEKKAFPKKIDNAAASPPKLPGISGKIFSIVKFILGVCLLPFVYSVSVAFLSEFSLVEKSLQGYFWAGVISFIILYLFIYAPAVIYRNGHRLLEIVFRFFTPLVRVAPYVLPIYAIIIFLGYTLCSLIFKSPQLINYFLFLFGFSLSLHLVFSSQSVRSKQEDFLKANYIFGFSLVYLINLLFLAFALNLILKEFSFVNFFNQSFQIAKSLFGALFRQLFL